MSMRNGLPQPSPRVRCQSKSEGMFSIEYYQVDLKISETNSLVNVFSDFD